MPVTRWPTRCMWSPNGCCERAGYRIVYPQNMDGLCCGLAPSRAKAFFNQADRKSKALEQALLAASDNGRLPVLCDTSPCLERMRRTFGPRLTLFEPVEFTATHLLGPADHYPDRGPGGPCTSPAVHAKWAWTMPS